MATVVLVLLRGREMEGLCLMKWENHDSVNMLPRAPGPNHLLTPKQTFSIKMLLPDQQSRCNILLPKPVIRSNVACQPVYSGFPFLRNKPSLLFTHLFSVTALALLSILALASKRPISEVLWLANLTADFHLSNLLLITFNGFFQKWAFFQIFNLQWILIWCKSGFRYVFSFQTTDKNCQEIEEGYILYCMLWVPQWVRVLRSYRTNFLFKRNANRGSS